MYNHYLAIYYSEALNKYWKELNQRTVMPHHKANSTTKPQPFGKALGHQIGKGLILAGTKLQSIGQLDKLTLGNEVPQ